MNLLSFLLDPLYDVNFLAKKHIHVVSPIEFDVMVDSSFFPYPGLQYWGGRGGGLRRETTWRENLENESLFLLEIL